jgi:hypothetical protein
MQSLATPKYMRCVGSIPRRATICAGTYLRLLVVDGSAPNRTAVVVDAWGAARPVCEDESGRWQLSLPDDGPVAELVFA